MPRRTRRARVLIADREVGMRKALSVVLEAESSIEVIGSASLGSTLLAKVEHLTPDVVVVGMGLPDGGVAVLRRIRASHPDLEIVLLVEGREQRELGSPDVAALGITEYFQRPLGNAEQVLATLRELLVPRIQALCAGFSSRNPSLVPAPSDGRPRLAPSLRGLTSVVRAVVLASSTGGPRALDVVLPALPVLPVPLLIVQHMPAEFTRAMAERLTVSCPFPVVEARAGDVVEPGKVWIAPGGWHLAVARKGQQVVTVTHQGPPENSCRPAADVLFRAAAEVWGAQLLGVVLTGMGQDGLNGSRQVVEAGGRVIVQDEASSVVWGMPGFVAQAGLADAVLPIGEISGEIQRRVLGQKVAQGQGARR